MSASSSTRSRRCWAEISLPALRHNLRVIRGLIPQGTRIMAVVKANAYGHGALPVARCCRAEKTEWLAVANTTELAELRRARIGGPIMLLSACLKEEMADAIRLRAAFTISSLEEARELAKVTRKLGPRTKPEVHLKVDTGMGRLGIWHEEAIATIERILALPELKVTGLYTHFARSDDHAKMTHQQFRRFVRVQQRFPQLLAHLANSHGLLGPAPYADDMVRAGIMLYGSSEDAAMREELRPLLTWKARITTLRDYAAGRTVSYGATYRLPECQRLAILSVGYADGYPRLLSNRGVVLIKGVRCPIRGRVTMDQTVVDVSALGPRVRVGDEAILLGSARSKRSGSPRPDILRAEELAHWARTISYEIYTGVSSRVERVWMDK